MDNETQIKVKEIVFDLIRACKESQKEWHETSEDVRDYEPDYQI
jgi:hypothetical protein